MIKNKMGALAGCVVLTLGLAACGSSSSTPSTSSTTSSTASSGSATISGAGSTFAAPVYEQWASALSGLTVNYQAVGSGAGITSVSTCTVRWRSESQSVMTSRSSPFKRMSQWKWPLSSGSG